MLVNISTDLHAEYVNTQKIVRMYHWVSAEGDNCVKVVLEKGEPIERKFVSLGEAREFIGLLAK